VLQAQYCLEVGLTQDALEVLGALVAYFTLVRQEIFLHEYIRKKLKYNLQEISAMPHKFKSFFLLLECVLSIAIFNWADW